MKFSKSDIIKAASLVAEQVGIEHIKARTVAKSLGSSVTPIYNEFDSLVELRTAVVHHALDLLMTYVNQPVSSPRDLAFSDGTFYRLGVGVAKFTLTHPMLFQAIFLSGTRFNYIAEAGKSALINIMAQDKGLINIPDDVKQQVFERMYTYNIGMTSRILANPGNKQNEALLLAEIMEVGAAIIGNVLNKKGVK